MSKESISPPRLSAQAKAFVPKTKSVASPSTSVPETTQNPAPQNLPTTAPSPSKSLNLSAKEFVPRNKVESHPVPQFYPVVAAYPVFIPSAFPAPEKKDEEDGSKVKEENKAPTEESRGTEAERKVQEDSAVVELAVDSSRKEDGEEMGAQLSSLDRKPTRLYAVDYLLQYRSKCQRRPKDMRAIEVPLRSNLNIKFEYQEVQRSETAEAVRNLRILLNKLAKDNFARIADTILNTFTFNPEVLEELARILFNKCVKEHTYIDVYMQLVDQLFRKFKVPKGADKAAMAMDFRRMFINSCQATFEDKSTEEFIRQLPTDIDEEEKKQKVKQRTLGNTKLIGQLFIRGVFLDTIIKSCLDSFFKEIKEEAIEKACNLLLTIGRKLYEKFAFDSDLTTNKRRPSIKLKVLNKEMFDDYIDKLVAMKQADALSSRVRFMIQDVIDARNEDWNNAFDKFPVAKRGGHDKIAEYRKKTKSIDKPVPEPSKAAAPAMSDPKIEQHELRKKSINEQNVFGRNIENYKKQQVEEHVRRRLYNAVDEYLQSRQVSEVADTVAEVVENEKIQKTICVGHFLLWGFSKNLKDFTETYKMVIELHKLKHIEMVDAQEGIMVTLANFYDTLIDNPNAQTQFQELVAAFLAAEVISKEQSQQYLAHVEVMKKENDSEYVK